MAQAKGVTGKLPLGWKIVVSHLAAVGVFGAVVLASGEWQRVLLVFAIAAGLAVILGIALARTITKPLADLTAAVEHGGDTRRSGMGRVRIPDLARSDEIGRLSIAINGMVTALYDRIDAHEQFAADVAHEVKNPLASLRAAVGALRVVTQADQRTTLLDVVDHDVRRLDRLISDITNASRLGGELVKERHAPFNLVTTLANLCQYLAKQAETKGVKLVPDLPGEMVIHGLEARLAQVAVNLVTNAISFCQPGGAVRIWARRRDDRVLIAVEDTGSGIPDQVLSLVFKRFYTERPPSEFGQHSGLGLAISKQIVQAHGGTIWAENIRPPGADPTAPPLGARFVVDLPV